MITTTNCVLYGLQKTNTYWQTTRPIILQPYFSQSNDYTREQVWRSGESARLPPMWPGFDSLTRRHMWVEFVVGSRPCSEGFSPGTPVFLRPQKPTFANSNSTWNAQSPLNEFLESSLVLVDVTLTRTLNLTLQTTTHACHYCDYTLHQKHFWNYRTDPTALQHPPCSSQTYHYFATTTDEPVKDRDEPSHRREAVYKIKCCYCQATYIGETGRNGNRN